MAKIGLLFGTQPGNTESIAQVIQAALGGTASTSVCTLVCTDDFSLLQFFYFRFRKSYVES